MAPPLGFTLLLVALVAGWGAAGAVPGAPPAAVETVVRGQVALPSGRVLQVEIADTPEKRAIGYMFRRRVTDREGMLFPMGQLDFHAFWMKNCKVALDILWLDENWRIVHMERKVPPCRQDPCPGYQPLQAALYVLEVKAGLADREGIRLGDHIMYTPPPPGR